MKSRRIDLKIILADFEHIEHVQVRLIIYCDCGNHMRFMAPVPVSEKHIQLQCDKCMMKHQIPVKLGTYHVPEQIS
jgi:hypothetical protein